MRVSGILTSVLIFGAPSASALAQAPSQADTRQSQARFEQAVRDGSTSPFYVAVTIINDRTGARRSGCWNVNFLEGAVMRERGLTFFEARDVLLQNTTHVFHFARQDALDNLPDRAQSDYACGIIATGAGARMRDRIGDIVSAP